MLAKVGVEPKQVNINYECLKIRFWERYTGRDD